MAAIVDPRKDAPVQFNLGFDKIEWVPPTELPSLGPVIAVDTETNDPLLTEKGPSWAFGEGEVVGFSVCDGNFKGYFPLAHLGDGNLTDLREPAIKWLKHHLEDPNRKIVFMNATYDLGWLETLGIKVAGEIHDVMLMAPLVYEHMWSYSLNSLLAFFLKDRKLKDEIKEHLKDHGLQGMGNMWKLPAQFVGPYAEQDAVGTFNLFEYLSKEIKEQDLEEVYEVERGLIMCMYEMRKMGVRVDVPKAEKKLEEYKRMEKHALGFIKDKTGCAVGTWDAASIAFALGERGIECPKTDAGNDSITKDFLLQHKEDEVVRAVLDARRAQKTYSSFIQNFVLNYQKNGRIHAQYNQLKSEGGGTISGRFSSSSPNMQQIPARDYEIGPRIRELFLPEEGQIWASNDYSSQEPRLTVHWAALAGVKGGQEAADAWNKDPDMDLHQMVADLCGISRKEAKTINLGITYGMGSATLCHNLGLPTQWGTNWRGDPREEAGPEGQALMRKYDETAPYVSALSEACIARSKERGYIQTLLKRRCRFELGLNPDEWKRRNEMDHYELMLLRGERLDEDGKMKLRPGKWYKDAHKALNRLIQGSAADQTKKAMLDIYKSGKIPLTTVHDEIGFSVENKEEAERLARIMEDAVPLKVPNKVDVETGNNWGESMIHPDKRREYFNPAGGLYESGEYQ